MKKFYVLPVLIILVFFITSCASMKLENYDFSGEKLIYETDFRSVQGPVEVLSEGQKVELDDGTLHLVGVQDGPAAHVELMEPFGNNTVLRFGLLLSESRPEAFINLFVQEENRMTIIFRDENIHVFANAGGQELYSSIKQPGIKAGIFHQVLLLIADYELLIFVDGKLLKKSPVPDGLPATGHLNLESHGEFWINNLIIESITRYKLLK